MPEFQRELDFALKRQKTAVIFAPNFLQHPEAAAFITETTARNLRAIVRLRPNQLVLFSELIANLDYRNASFEVVVSEPLSERVLTSRRAFPEFKTVVVPTRAYDPELLFDSLPFSWRRSIEILSPIGETDARENSFLSADETFLAMKSLGPRARAYAELDRAPRGVVPGSADRLRFEYKALGFDETAITLSVLFAFDMSTNFESLLNAFKKQVLSKQRFELVFAFDRLNDDVVENLNEWSRESGLTVRGFEMARGWTEPLSRRTQAWNLAATEARGSSIFVAASDFLAGATDEAVRSLLTTAGRDLQTEALITYRDLKTSELSLCLTLRHYFDVAGFANVQQTPGFEQEFMLWKSARVGVVPKQVELARTLESTQSMKPIKAKLRVRAAQEFYLCTLDATLFESRFHMMGRWSFVRRAAQWFGRLSSRETTRRDVRGLSTASPETAT